MVTVSLSLDAISAPGARRGLVLVLLVFGLASLAAYWLHAARTDGPLFPLSLFKVHSFAVGLLGNLFSRVGSGGMPYLIPLLMQVAMGFSPMQAGMMMIPAAVAGMFSKRIVVRLVHRLGYRRVLVGNTVLVGLAMASFALVHEGQPLWLYAVQFACFGFVNSLQFTAMNTLALRDLDGELASSGNSLLSMVMMLAMSLGVASAAGLLGVFGGAAGAIDRQQMADAFRGTFVCVGLVTMASAAIFAQLEPTNRIPESTVQKADPA
jgi:predicted MFS family arabinose efflux permease